MKNKKIDIESLERHNVHHVPDGYFDHLPLKIQTRIDNEKEQTFKAYIPGMQIAWRLTAVAAMLWLGWFFYPSSVVIHQSAEEIVAQIPSDDLIQYLYNEELTTEEILAVVDEVYILNEMSEMASDIIDADVSHDDLEEIYSELDFSTEIM